MTNGVLNIYKEPGYTSGDVVAKLRGMYRQRKVGHTGTLDPAAEGVLPVCLGSATKLVGMMTDETNPIRLCRQCMKPYIADNPDQEFCSRECEQKFMRESKHQS